MRLQSIVNGCFGSVGLHRCSIADCEGCVWCCPSTRNRNAARLPRVLGVQYHQFIYPTLSGVLGAQSVLFAKSTAELVKSAFRGDSPFASVMTYVIIVCMFSTIFMQLHWLAVALQWFDAVYCIPVFQVRLVTSTAWCWCCCLLAFLCASVSSSQ